MYKIREFDKTEFQALKTELTLGVEQTRLILRAAEKSPEYNSKLSQFYRLLVNQRANAIRSIRRSGEIDLDRWCDDYDRMEQIAVDACDVLKKENQSILKPILDLTSKIHQMAPVKFSTPVYMPSFELASIELSNEGQMEKIVNNMQRLRGELERRLRPQDK